MEQLLHAPLEHGTTLRGMLSAQMLTGDNIDIKSLQNRLLKVCYVPATSAGLPRLLFAAAINSANEANKAGNTCR
jgi:hypothetical protein